VLTKDDAIRRNPLERRALRAANVRAFILTSQNMSGPDMAELVVRFLPTIEKLAKSGKQPFIALVTRSSVAITNLKGSRR